ncbi:MAG: LamG domain-containing protein [Verrucomicrobiota bacterium]
MQASTNLVEWVALGTNTVPFTFVDSDMGQSNERFYRAVLASSIAVNSPGGITNGLVAWFPLAGNANDYSTNGNNGYFVGSVTPTVGVNGTANTAILFSNSYMVVPHVLIQSNTSFSISVWLQPNELPGSYQVVADAGNFNNGSAGWGLGFDELNRIIIVCGGGNAESPFVFSTGLFYHVVATAQAGSPYVFALYINGENFGYGGSTSVTNWAENASVSQFAGSVYGTMYPFDGAMADVRVYNRVLLPAEIMLLYTNGSSRQVEPPGAVKDPDLIYLKFLEDITADPKYSYTNWPAPLRDSSVIDNTNVLYYSNEGSHDDVWVDVNGVVAAGLHWHGVNGSYADTGDSNHFAFTTNSYTIALWVQPYTAGGTFLSCGVAGTNGWCVNEDTNYNLFFNTYTNGVATSVGSVPVHNNAFHAILVSVANGTNVCVYEDGVASATGVVNVPAPSGTNTLMLGQQNLGPNFGRTLDGNMWMTQIWSTNLADMDAVYLYLNQLIGSPWPN